MKSFIKTIVLLNSQKQIASKIFIPKRQPISIEGLIKSKQCSFHTSSRHQALPPLIWALFAKPIAKLAAILTGRGIRKWWTSLPADKKMHLLMDHLKAHRIRYSLILALTSGGSATYYYTHLQLTPITHRKRFIIFDSSHLAEFEKIEMEKMKEMYKDDLVDPKSEISVRALRVAKRLFEANKHMDEISKIQWKLTVIDDKTINAVAFPSGELIVFTGLLKFVKNDDELATILAHEMSHAILQHAAEELSHKHLIDILYISLAMMVWAILPTDITAILTQQFVQQLRTYTFEYPHSREIEKEADFVGLQLAARACFDIRQSPEFWKRMSSNEGKLKYPEALSTHPSSDSRAIDLQRFVPKGLMLRKECNCYELSDRLDNTNNKN